MLVLALDVQQNDAYYLPLICQDYAHLVPFASVKDFNPGKLHSYFGLRAAIIHNNNI